MSRILRFISISICIVLMLPAIAIAGPYGNPFRITSYSTSHQWSFSTATGANGDTAFLWQDGNLGNAMVIQRYNAAGLALQASAWVVNASAVDLAVSGNGSYAILDGGSDGAGAGVFVTVHDRAGNVIVSRFRVNDTVVGDQYPSAIAMNASGQFAVIWKQPAGNGIYVKRYQANGTAVASETLANTVAANSYMLDIAIDGSGNFIATWDQLINPNPPGDIDSYGRRFNASGVPVTAPFRINTTTPNLQASPRIAMNNSGAFTIVWTSYAQSAPGVWAIYGQRYNASGTSVGSEFQVSVQTSASQQGLAVAMADNGGFLVTWNDDNRSLGGPLPYIFARSYDSSGVAYAVPFDVSADSVSYNAFPQASMDPDGNAYVFWRKYNYSTSEYDAYVRRYMPGNASAQTLADGQLVTGLSGAASSWQYFKITVLPGQNTLDVSMLGSIGDADLYVRYGALPSYNNWDGRPYYFGSNENVSMVGFPPGDWYIGINGYTAYSGLSVQPDAY